MPRITKDILIKKHAKEIKKWGLHHCRVDLVEYETDAGIKRECVYSIAFGRTHDPHREDGPAEIAYDCKGGLAREVFYINGIPHRTDGPVGIHYLDGKVGFLEYLVNGRYHREDGPSLVLFSPNTKDAFAKGSNPFTGDETEIYYLFGLKLNKQIVLHPETLTITQIKEETNIEIQRIMIERYGWLNYLSGIKAKVIHKSTNLVDNTNEVLVDAEFNIHHSDSQRLIVCSCPSTGRVYAIPVPNKTKSCHEAQEYLKGERLKNIRIIGAS